MLRRIVDVLGIIGVLIGAVALYRQFVIDPGEAKAREAEIRKDVLSQTEEQRFIGISRNYQDLLTNANIEHEVQVAAGTLREIHTISLQFKNHPDPLRRWVFERQMTTPQYVHVLDEAGLLTRQVISRDADSRHLVQIYLWQVNEAGEKAIQRRDFSAVRKVMENSIQRAEKYGLGNVNRLLYGRYWGVALVTKSSYSDCDAWVYEEAREVDSDPPLEPPIPETDNRIFGRVEIRMIAGVAWRGVPLRERQSVDLISEHGGWFAGGCPTTNNIGIRGCPKAGDVLGFFEDTCLEQWEKVGGG